MWETNASVAITSGWLTVVFIIWEISVVIGCKELGLEEI